MKNVHSRSSIASRRRRALAATLCAWLASGSLGLARGAVQLPDSVAQAPPPTFTVPSEDAPATRPTSRALRPVDPGGVVAAGWRARLTADDMDARERAYGELLLEARRNASLILALEAWAANSEDVELAWTARLALRQIDRRDAPPTRLRLRWITSARTAPLSPGTLRALGAQGGTPETSLPVGQALAGGSASRGALLEALPPQQFAPFGGAQALSLIAPRGFALTEQPDGEGTRPTYGRVLQTYKLEVQPEGVSLTVLSQSGRGEEQQVYAAEDLTALLAEHPELRVSVPGIEGLERQSIGNGIYYQWKAHTELLAGASEAPGFGPASPSTTAPFGATHVPTDILGVRCTPLSALSGDTLQGIAGVLGPGVGLRIEGRVPGTIASELDLKRGDILVELNGEPLCSADEIGAALGRAQGGCVTVKILDGDGLERTMTWKPQGCIEMRCMEDSGMDAAAGGEAASTSEKED